MVPFGLNLDRDEGSSQRMKTWRKRLQTEGTAHADPQEGYSQVLKAAFFPCSFFFIFEFTYFNRGLLYPTSWEVYLSLPTWRKTRWTSLKRSGPYVASSLSQVLNPWSPGSFLGAGGGAHTLLIEEESFASWERRGPKGGGRCLFPLGKWSGNDYALAQNQGEKYEKGAGLGTFPPKAE